MQVMQAKPMKSLREALPDGFVARMQRELGSEETLRILWPMVVGAELGANTRLLSIRQNRLRIAVPDQTWKRTLLAMEQAVLEAVHRVCGKDVGRAIDLVEDASLTGLRLGKAGKGKEPGQGKAGKGKSTAPLRPAGLPDFPLDGIRDAELQRMFRQSAQKYFARRDEDSQ
jgi:hypothetical protein